MDSNIQNPQSESEPQGMAAAPEPAEAQPVDTWYTSEQLAGDPPAAQQAESEPPLQPEIVASPSSYSPPLAESAPPPKKNNSVTVILIVLLVLLCICCLCFFLIFSVFGSLLGGIYQWTVDFLNALFGGWVVIQ